MLLIVPFVGFDPRAFSGEPRAVQHEKEQIPQYVEEWSIERLLIFFFFLGGGGRHALGARFGLEEHPGNTRPRELLNKSSIWSVGKRIQNELNDEQAIDPG